MAVGVGFEPTVGYQPTPVFKTGAFNRSATPPLRCGRIIGESRGNSNSPPHQRCPLQVRKSMFFAPTQRPVSV